MNKEKLSDLCTVLEQVIIEVAKIYNAVDATPNQKALLETMIGAAIWYLPSSGELYSGFISTQAIEKIQHGTPISNLVKEHKFPRKQAGKLLLSETYKKLLENEESLYNLYINKFGKFNLVVKSENRDLVPFQRAAFVDDITSYKEAGIKLVKMSIDDIKRLQPENSKLKSKEVKVAGKVRQQKPELIDQQKPEQSHLIEPEEIGISLQQVRNNDDGRGFVFNGISLNGKVLYRGGNASKCYKAFMNYIIENFENQIENSEFIRNLIRPDRNAPEFKTDPVKYPYVIINHGRWFYNVHSNSSVKKNRIITIANELRLSVEFFY